MHENLHDRYTSPTIPPLTLPDPDIFLTTLSPETLAQQLSLYDSGLFRNIHSVEFLNLIWTKVSPALEFFMQRFDMESYWVATDICRCGELKDRVGAMKRWVETAKVGLWSMFYFTCGLRWPFFGYWTRLAWVIKTFSAYFPYYPDLIWRQCSGWSRVGMYVRNCWIWIWPNRPFNKCSLSQALPAKTKKTLTELESFTDVSRNFKSYRDILSTARPPLVPFLRT